MTIRTVVTRGYGNGTFNGTIPLVVTRGYAIGEEAVVTLKVGRVYLAGASTSRLSLNGYNEAAATLSGTDGNRAALNAPEERVSLTVATIRTVLVGRPR